MALLDPSSEEYRVVAGIIRSAHRRIGATESHRWNGDIGVLSTLSRQRSRSDLDGTIHLHPRNVINPLTRAHAGGGERWWYPRAARDAAYNVIYEALRHSSRPDLKPAPAEPGKSLDSALRPGARSLDMALAEQRTYEITEAIMSENDLAQAYSEDPPEAATVGGHGPATGMPTPFRLTTWSTTATAAARGFVDGVQDASGLGREEVFDSLLTEAKASRWSLAFKLVTDQHHPGLLSDLPPGTQLSVYQEVSRQATSEWNRGASPRRLMITTVEAATEWGYAIGRETADLVVDMAQALDKLPTAVLTQEQARESAPDELEGDASDGPQATESPAEPEISPGELFGAQAGFTGVAPPSSTPAAGPGTSGSERQPQIEK